ncbi:MAG: TIGR01777 family oxidoreductase [Candidatus Dormibacteria bacterium]
MTLEHTQKRIVIVGARGLIGQAVATALRTRGDMVIATSRTSSDLPNADETIVWNPHEELFPGDLLQNVDAICNFAGEPLAPKRWTVEQKRKIRASRILTTHKITDALRSGPHHPALINASAIGYYPVTDALVDTDNPAGSDFLADVCVEWERTARAAESYGSRVVVLRTGVVLDRDGGVFPLMMLPIKLGVGGRLGSGKQWISWIHIDDAVGLVLYAIDTQSVHGPLNLVSPEPMQQEQFTKAAAHILRRPAFFPTPSVVITTMLGETSTLLLDSHRVAAPQGIRYRFRYSTLENALRELLTSSHHEDVAS